MRASARLRRHYQHCKLRASGALGSLRTFDEPPMTGTISPPFKVTEN
jgi:hypothetical protein